MNFEKMSKDQLIEEVERLKLIVEENYEKIMKLRIIDSSPFTVWACDRDCKIRLWSGKAKELYGIPKNEAIGKDFVDLFVTALEKNQARIDCIDIVDNGAIFHNLANDEGRFGKLLLLTNCYRVKDCITDEWLQAEMGLVVNYLDEEWERLKKIREEGNRMLEIKEASNEEIKLFKKFINLRVDELYRLISKSLERTVCTGNHDELLKELQPIRESINEFNEKFLSALGRQSESVNGCLSLKECSLVADAHGDIVRRANSELNDIILKFKIVDQKYQGDSVEINVRTGLHVRLYDEYRRTRELLDRKLKDFETTLRKLTPATSATSQIQEEATLAENIRRSCFALQKFRNDVKRRYEELLQAASQSRQDKLDELQSEIDTYFSNTIEKIDTLSIGEEI